MVARCTASMKRLDVIGCRKGFGEGLHVEAPHGVRDGFAPVSIEPLVHGLDTLGCEWHPLRSFS